MHLPVGITLQGGKYEIISYISSGGFGCTYKARHAMLNTTVAIKEFFVKDYCNRDASTYSISVATQSKAELIERLSRKFIEEARAIFNMNHPNIVRVTDIFEENGTVYYVMDYIEGCSFASLIADKGRLSEKEALGFICQVADALGYVHSCNRLHLDVKPQNIMIDKSGKAILIDFGVSKQYDEVNGENTSTLLGSTPGYAPIEQSGNGVLRFYPSADIYALGATLYKALAGVTPVAAHLRASGEELDPLPSNISPATCEAVEAAMKINKAHRPQSVAEFLKLLENGGKSKDERVKSKDETILNSSSTPRGEVSRSDGGKSELSKVKTENGKLKTVSEVSAVSSAIGHGQSRQSCDPVGCDETELSNVKTEKKKSKLPLIIIILLLSVILGVGGYQRFCGSGEENMDFTVNGVNLKMETVKAEINEVISGIEYCLNNNEEPDNFLTQDFRSLIEMGWNLPYGDYSEVSLWTESQDYNEIKIRDIEYESVSDNKVIVNAKFIDSVWGEMCSKRMEFVHINEEWLIEDMSFCDSSLKQYTHECIAREQQQGISTEKKVDLGLSVYWAGWNVGASSPEGDGGYYAWGETTEKTDYTESSYQYYNNGYIDIGSNISDTRYDVALAEWGSGWRMPSEKEFEELLNKCTWTWTTYKGVNGYKVTGPNGNSIFLPAAGYRDGTELHNRGSYGYYWSGSLTEVSSYNLITCYLSFYGGYHNLNYIYFRDYGRTVRPVCNK